jgi:hypothetical protein
MTNFKVLLKTSQGDHTLDTTHNVEHSRSRGNGFHYTQLSPYEIITTEKFSKEDFIHINKCPYTLFLYIVNFLPVMPS